MARAVKVFERDLRCIVEEANPGWENPYAAFRVILAGKSGLNGMRAMEKQLGDKMTQRLREFITTEWTAEQLTEAVMTRKTVNNKMWRFTAGGTVESRSLDTDIGAAELPLNDKTVSAAACVVDR